MNPYFNVNKQLFYNFLEIFQYSLTDYMIRTNFILISQIILSQIWLKFQQHLWKNNKTLEWQTFKIYYFDQNTGKSKLRCRIQQEFQIQIGFFNELLQIISCTQNSGTKYILYLFSSYLQSWGYFTKYLKEFFLSPLQLLIIHQSDQLLIYCQIDHKNKGSSIIFQNLSQNFIKAVGSQLKNYKIRIQQIIKFYVALNVVFSTQIKSFKKIVIRSKIYFSQS
ncbi:hypothetical protein ABPG72_009491 [Tetrahymena utriculariae]